MSNSRKGDIPGFVHLYAGEEASGTGIMMHLNDNDRIASTHRGHGHCIAKGVDVKEMMAEIYGKATGSCRGKGGSMHIADLSKGMMGANGILGAGAPLDLRRGACRQISRRWRRRHLLCRRRRLEPGHVPRKPQSRGGVEPARRSSSSRTTAMPNRPRATRRSRSTPMSIAPRASACPASPSTAPISSPSTRRRARSSSGRAKAAARRCSNARWSASTATSRAIQQTYRGKGEVEDIRANKDCIKLFQARSARPASSQPTNSKRSTRQVARLIEEAVTSSQGGRRCRQPRTS